MTFDIGGIEIVSKTVELADWTWEIFSCLFFSELMKYTIARVMGIKSTYMNLQYLLHYE